MDYKEGILGVVNHAYGRGGERIEIFEITVPGQASQNVGNLAKHSDSEFEAMEEEATSRDQPLIHFLDSIENDQFSQTITDIQILSTNPLQLYVIVSSRGGSHFGVLEAAFGERRGLILFCDDSGCVDTYQYAPLWHGAALTYNPEDQPQLAVTSPMDRSIIVFDIDKARPAHLIRWECLYIYAPPLKNRFFYLFEKKVVVQKINREIKNHYQVKNWKYFRTLKLRLYVRNFNYFQNFEVINTL